MYTWYEHKNTYLYVGMVNCDFVTFLKVIKWKEKCADAEIKLVIVQDSANTLAMAKVHIYRLYIY